MGWDGEKVRCDVTVPGGAELCGEGARGVGRQRAGGADPAEPGRGTCRSRAGRCGAGAAGHGSARPGTVQPGAARSPPRITAQRGAAHRGAAPAQPH